MLRDSKTLKSCPAVFREVYPIKGFLKLPGPGNALASKPGSRVVAVQLNFGTGEGHCLASSLSLLNSGEHVGCLLQRSSVRLFTCTRGGNLALQ